MLTHFNRWCAALDVSTFEGLCELIVLEQFTDSMPSRIATFLQEREVTTAMEAAVLADNYVRTHKNGFGEPRARDDQRKEFSSVGRSVSHGSERSSPTINRGSQGRFGSGRESMPGPVDCSSRGKGDPDGCNYCHSRGHWKGDCPVLKSRLRPGNVKGSALVGQVPAPSPMFSPVSQALPECSSSGLVTYSPFITDGYVSLVGRDEKVPIRILRDTGACDSFILASVLPFSSESDTGDRVLVRGMGLNTLCVPLHTVVLHSELVQGEVILGVRPALPIEGVDLILGNSLAGGRVWAGVPPPVVIGAPLVTDRPDECVQCYPEVFTACAVTPL